MTSNKPLSAQQFEAVLGNFIGSQNSYYRETPLGRIEYTDGILFLQQNGCFWLIDAIASYQTQQFKSVDEAKRAVFGGRQFWKLRVDLDTHSGKLICDDGNGNVRVTQEIEFTDFPLSKLDIYVEIQAECVFLCLMSEY
jgi:hypothetical protein